jgi:hypothetical protein
MFACCSDEVPVMFVTWLLLITHQPSENIVNDARGSARQLANIQYLIYNQIRRGGQPQDSNIALLAE